MKIVARILIIFIFALISCKQTQEYKDSNNIVIDQFGYKPDAEKIAIIRQAHLGYDSTQKYSPAKEYSVLNEESNEIVFTATTTAWKNNEIDSASGDKVWYFDFSSVQEEGSYRIIDEKNKIQSYSFKIAKNVYEEVLKHAFKTFYYQRSGFEKTAEFAGEGWADKASHVGPLQDKNCREWGKATDSTTERDVHGGWYDAGDFNKYTNWTSDYINTLLLSYEENPQVWTDDFEIPESGNGIPDILDEVRFGLEHLLRLQFDNGSCIAVLGECATSPPSKGTDQSFWGGPSTSATLSCATSFAYGAKIYAQIDSTFANNLHNAALKAYNWAVENPNVTFHNNSAEHGTQGLAKGPNEVDDYGRMVKRMNAAMHLYILTGESQYKEYFEKHVFDIHLFTWNFLFPFGSVEQDMLAYYTQLDNVSPAIVKSIKEKYTTTLERENNYGAIDSKLEAYLAYTKDFDWGSNGIIAKQGIIYYNGIQYNIHEKRQNIAKNVAARYIHYLHGVNPLNKCYLTNMYKYGGDNCANVMFHAWFKDGCELWGDCRTSKYGPAPGFVVGGANPSFQIDGCCPNTCGSEYNNSFCYETAVKNLLNQPKLKSYSDINSGWPQNSWEVTENSGWYQTMYLRLLSKYVE